MGKFADAVKAFTTTYQAPSNNNPPPPRPDTRELSTSTSGLFRFWASRPFNPRDDLAQVRSLRIYDEMRNDDQVKAAMNLKKGAILSTGWELISASDDPQDQEVRDGVEWMLTHLDPLYGSFDDIIFEILSAFDFGFSISEILWKVLDDGPVAGKFGLRTIKTREPFLFGFDMDPHDNLLKKGIVQEEQKYDPNKFLIYTYQKEFGNFFGLSDLRAAYRPWWLKDNVYKWWGIFLERFGIPMSVGKYPSSHNRPADIVALRTILTYIQANTSITIPNDFELEFIQAAGQGGMIFQKAIQEMNMAIARSLLVPSLLGVSTQQDTGSFSQARKHFDVFLIVIGDARRDISVDVIQNQLISRIVSANWAVEEDPQFQFKPFTEGETLELFGKWIEAVEAKIVKKTEEDEIHIRNITGFPERDLSVEIPDDPEPPKIIMPPPPPPPAPDVDPGEPGEGDSPPGTAQEMQEKVVNVQRIIRKMDKMENSAIDRITDVMEGVKESVVALLARKISAKTLTPAFISTIVLKDKGNLNRVLRALLLEGYRDGKDEGRAMLPVRRLAHRISPGLAPDKALEFFDVKASEGALALKEQMRIKVKRIALNAVKTGEPLDETIQKVEDLFEPILGTPTVGEAGQIKAIVRTNMNEAFNKGIKDELQPEVDDGFIIGYKYAAVLDSKTTPVCRFLNKRIFRPNSQGLEQLTPPNHFNCRSIITPITKFSAPVSFITDRQIGSGLTLRSSGFSEEPHVHVDAIQDE